MYLVVHVSRHYSRDGQIVYRIFTVTKTLQELDVLHLGNLKIVKCYDFWIPAHELEARTGLVRVEELIGKRVYITSACGRILSLEVHSEDRATLNSIYSEFASKPIGVRAWLNHIILAFSETLYVTSQFEDIDVDLKFYTGIIRKFLVGASVKTYFRIIEKLKEISQMGLFGKKKISLAVDFVKPLQDDDSTTS